MESQKIKEYFENIKKKLNNAYELANEARGKKKDPEKKVEVILADNLVQRVEGLVSIITPQIINSGMAQRIVELEKKYGFLDWRISLIIAEEVAMEKFCKFKNKLEAIETGIRVGLAYHTLGTVASPIEGITQIKIRKNRQGNEYLSIFFSGPIRSAGGTGASVSVLIADYIRKKFGYDKYDPTEEEVRRMVTEIIDYHERVTNLQYFPSEEEVDFLVRNIPLQIDGEPSEKIEVSNYKDLERIETNNVRNGPCLVIGEGIAQKAPKLWKQLSKWGNDFNLEWNFLEEFLKIQKKKKSRDLLEESKEKIKPDYTFIKDLPAGRLVLTHPLKAGGFRLRYGRSRISGYSSCSIHPATMHILNQYIATGTQLKMERPGKATAVTPCDSIEGPIVELENGNLIRIDSENEAKKIRKEIKKIYFLGDILVSYGDFFNRAHILIPPGYCEEWWIKELEKATVDLFGALDSDKLAELLEINKNELEPLLKNPFKCKPDAKTSIMISKKLNIPLHPLYTYHWKTITSEQFFKLINWLNDSNIVKEDGEIKKIVLPNKLEKEILGLLGIPHLSNKEFVIIEKNEALSLLILNLDKIKIEESNKDSNVKILDLINLVSSVKIMDKSGIFIGARMGRPEKAKIRKLIGSPHVLFPVGEEGNRLRSFQSALEIGKVRADFPIFYCPACKRETIYPVCEVCETDTKKMFFCQICGNIESQCKHGYYTFKTKNIDIRHFFDYSLKKIKMSTYPDLIKGVKGTSNQNHIPENLIKGILRAKYDIYVNKDGTTRYDMTQIPLTHFKPKEINVSIEKLKELGYDKDIHNLELTNNDQILELKPQDVILPSCQQSPDEGSDKILFRTSKFVDDLLVNFYNLPPYYNLKSEDELIGHLIVALAPHTSAAILGRIIGFSLTQVFLCHPMFHAATRRDCDGDESCCMLLMDTLLNFSKHYLPRTRGSTQDAPLVLTTKLIPAEVDDMFFDLDVAWSYPLEFYKSCLEYKNPWDLKIDQIKSRLGTEKQYEGMGFTHEISNINVGIKCSAYKTIPTMEEKLKGQMELSEKIRAVDESDVARLVIEKHFLKDTKGNLRKFSMQKFRCSICNHIYRRPPLLGKCTKCNGRLIFTISQGSVVKYLEPSISLANKYNVPSYLKQTLELLKRRVESIFGKEKEKQIGLGSWFN